MQLFNAFCKIAWRKLPSIAIYFVVYIILTLALGATSKKNIDSNFQTEALNICVIDEDQSVASSALTSYLDSRHNLIDIENNPETIQDNIYYRYICYVLTIPAGFDEKLQNGETSGLLTNVRIPDSSSGHFINQQIDEYLQAIQLYMVGGYSLEDAIAATDEGIGASQKITNLTFESEGASERTAVYYFYQYLPYIFIVLLMCGLAPIIVTLQRRDILERTSCSSLSLSARNTQISLGCICYSLFIWVCFLILGLIVYGADMLTSHAVYAMLNSFVFLMIAAALTLFVSNFAPDGNVVNMVSNIIGLGMCFVCGVFVPQSMLSDQVLLAARFLPAYWYIRANNMLGGLSSEGFNLNLYWTAIGLQILFAAALFAATMVASKLRRQRITN